MPLPRCFFDVSINGVPAGRIVFELFSDVCPKTTENFRCLCTGEKGEGKTTFKPLHYKGTPIHRIVKGFIIQGGDFSNGDGTGGESIYGGMFKDEGFHYKHDKPFLLSMANKGQHTNGSQFFITTKPAPHLDGLHVVFGQVIQGNQYVVEMENQKVDTNHRPYADVRITNCGELVLLKSRKSKLKKVKASSNKSETEGSSESDSSSEEDQSSSESVPTSSSSSEEEEKKKRKKRRRKSREEDSKQKKRRRRERRSKKKDGKRKKKASSSSRAKKKRKQESESSSPESESDSGSGSELEPAIETPEEAVTSTIAEEAEEVPPEINTTSKSWLFRSSRTPSPRAGDKKDKKKSGDSKVVEDKKPKISQSGRKLKGRGVMRYRTPPRFSGRGYNDSYERSGRRRSRSPSPQRHRGWYGQARRDRSRSRSRERSNRRRDRDRSPRYRRGRSRSRSPLRERRRRPTSRDSPVVDSTQSTSDVRDNESRFKEGSENEQKLKQKDSIESNDDKSYKTRRRSPSPDRDRERHHRRRHRDESSSPPRRRDDMKRDSYRRRRRSSSSSGDARRGRRSRRSHDRESFDVKEQKSKWARHHDSAESSSEEDSEPEKKEAGLDDEEDVFGINKLSSEMI